MSKHRMIWNNDVIGLEPSQMINKTKKSKEIVTENRKDIRLSELGKQSSMFMTVRRWTRFSRGGTGGRGQYQFSVFQSHHCNG